MGEKSLLIVVALFTLEGILSAIPADASHAKKDYPIKPVPFTNVIIEDKFWAPRLETNRQVSMPYAFRHIEEMGIVGNFAIAGGLEQGSYKGSRQYHDSELFKVIEGASYTLRLAPDAMKRQHFAVLARLIATAQEDDGYSYTWRIVGLGQVTSKLP